MSTFRTIIFSLTILFSFQASAQMENAIADLNFKLKMMEDNMTWGVFVVAGERIVPSNRANTGSGQVTIVAPAGFIYAGLENISGTWIENARVDGPMEAPANAYISFGFVADEPRIKYRSGEETLLFTFIPEDVNAVISLIDNQNDPFSTPNTFGSNPGNDLGVIDFNRSGSMLVYQYGTNLPTEVNNNVKATFASDAAKEVQEYKAIFTTEKVGTLAQ